MDGVGRALQRELAGRVELEYPLAPLTTYRLGGPAALYVEPDDEKDLARLIEILADAKDAIPMLPFGRGSNLVVSDSGWPGIVVRLGKQFARIEDGAGSGRPLAGAATPLPQLANWCASRGLAGLEFGVGIPGSVGGGVRMNAGAHGLDIGAVLESVIVWDLATGRLEEIAANRLGLSYRHSSLRDDQLVSGAIFALRADDLNAIRIRAEGFRRHRAETQPGALANAGSVFKNPPGDHAGRLVEAAGLKGFRVGGAAVSDLHANFFIAKPGATSQDVHDLVEQVAQRVEGTFGVRLEPEIRFVGAFLSRVARGAEAP